MLLAELGVVRSLSFLEVGIMPSSEVGCTRNRLKLLSTQLPSYVSGTGMEKGTRAIALVTPVYLDSQTLCKDEAAAL
jgi:hypothetical protein